VPRQDGFDIVAASEVMAILCLADSLADLKERLGRIVVGYRADSSPVLARELKAHGAMAALLEDGAGAQSGADPREQSGLHPRRSVRQHCATAATR